MRTARFGAAGPEVPVVGQGSWNFEQEDPGQVERALVAGLDAGMTHVDTAEMYGDGEVERLVGRALEGRRDEVFLVSKVLPQNATRRGTIEACERSLGRLRTERLDVYLLHWPGRHPLADTVAGFEALVAAGKIRAWGVSNFDEEELAELLAIVPPDRVACNQVLYHLDERAIEHAVIPFCREHGIAVVAYSPFGSGSFPARRSAGHRVLEDVGQRHGATPHQVALAFLLRDGRTFAIPRSADVEHARQNAAAADLVLAEEEIARIDAAFPRGPRRRGVPTL
jgi:diketogulonate reductase-like aldo/keto reductase